MPSTYDFATTLSPDRNVVGTGLDYSHSSDPMYEAYYAANPYVGQTYRKTIWDNLFSGIFRTKYDQWLNEMSVNAAQYDAGIVDLQQQNLYNSEVAKAARMRAAGENPDLLGTGDVADAANTNPDPQDAQIPEAADFSQVASFAGMIAQCFQGALGMASAGIDLVGKLSQIDNQNISNASGYQDLALDFIRNSIPSVGLESDADYASWKEKLGALSSPDVAWNESLARSLGLSKRQRKSFDLALNNQIGSLPAEYERFKMLDDFADKKLSSARKTSSSFYHDSFEVMKVLSDELVTSRDQLESLKARVDVLEQDVREENLNVELFEGFNEEAYQKKKYQLGMGTTKAIVENEDFNLQKLQQSIDRTLKQTRNKILARLNVMADAEGNSFAQYMIYNMMLHEYMNFDFKANLDLGLKKLAGSKGSKNGLSALIPNVGLNGEFGISF